MTTPHDAVCACPNDGSDPGCNYLPVRLDAAWEALLRDLVPISDVDQAILDEHRPRIEAAIRAEAEAEAEALQEALSLADRWIIDRSPYVNAIDHACAECVPGGPLVSDTFRCAVHAAKLRAALTEGSER